MKFLVVQAHLDDVFFSTTETAITWAEDGHDVHVLTVFGGVPKAEKVGEDRHLKHIAMWQEYEAAIERGPFEHYLALDYMDDAARTDQLMYDRFIKDVRKAAKAARADITVWPQGIHHPDHILTKACMINPHADWVYDELPYYVMYPEQAVDPGPISPLWLREGSRPHLEAKKRLCRLFGTQIGDTEERCLWAPERVWRPV